MVNINGRIRRAPSATLIGERLFEIIEYTSDDYGDLFHIKIEINSSKNKRILLKRNYGESYNRDKIYDTITDNINSIIEEMILLEVERYSTKYHIHNPVDTELLNFINSYNITDDDYWYGAPPF